ncbi:maleylpyruvate isomerase N-terminal domain-containing protein [Micromonospora sp. WMMD1102]|uniref:maleylpyruvate isomerase N-terminal domain-containing protein n=1 Tax=Micromonospora sp. WMMD1102 TaxID=3016105 RepID=UPI00241536F6|nr:maleylpyruvate isomerase N-terminal domain-containing protein [Micromonospora sp. WMMD1102]MDG4786479.1 maleylpyruvate isomerase N-terminal domain-containing protein [Micromonospora sp. WMMD1102]
MRVVEVFRGEAVRLAEVLAGLTESDFARPTRCAPWTVLELAAHVRTGAGRVVGMLAEPAPPHAEVDAAAYFGPAKFTAGTDADRIDTAREEGAGFGSGRELAEDFAHTWRAGYDASLAAPPGRVVRTRHGDPMTLDEFLVTRVVELGVHGLDLADALDREPWLTGPAAELIAGLLTMAAGPAAVGLAEELRWDRSTLIAKATGRRPLTGPEQTEIDRRGVRWLTFGG